MINEMSTRGRGKYLSISLSIAPSCYCNWILSDRQGPYIMTVPSIRSDDSAAIEIRISFRYNISHIPSFKKAVP